MKREILLIDNLDSFSFNLVESFQRLGCTGQTLRNSVVASEALKIAETRSASVTGSKTPSPLSSVGQPSRQRGRVSRRAARASSSAKSAKSALT